MHLLENFSTIERSIIHQASVTRTPVSGSIELLPLCNMNCDMCYVRLSKEEMESQGRLRTTEEWLAIARQMQKAGTLFLLLTGGEPLLYPEFKTLYLELQKLGMILTINTNGTLIDEEWAEFFEKHKLRRINITLYGVNEETYQNLCHYPGGFKKTINAIQLLKKHNIDVKISSSLTKTNLIDMEKIIDIGNGLDVPVRIDTYMLPAIRERNKPFSMQSRATPTKAADIRIRTLKKEMGASLFHQYKQRLLAEVEQMSSNTNYTNHMSCFAGKSSFTINWQGEMRPCVILSEPSISVFDKDFETAWKYIVEETDKILLHNKCNTCKYRPICRTCAACALLESGNYNGIPQYMCKYAAKSLQLLYDS